MKIERVCLFALIFLSGLALGQLYTSKRYVEYHYHQISFVLCGHKHAVCEAKLNKELP